MNIIPCALKAAFVLTILFLCSCQKDINDMGRWYHGLETIEISDPKDVFFNLPYSQDTFLVDHTHNIDFRIEIAGHRIDSVLIHIDKSYKIKSNTPIIRSASLRLSKGIHDISFLFRTRNTVNGEVVYFESNSLVFNCLENLSNRFVNPIIDDGKLKLVWREFDKVYTKKYKIERWIIDDKFSTSSPQKKYHQLFEVENAEFIDDYYVGEAAEYKITMLNKDGFTQDVWYYKKSKEPISHKSVQTSSEGYKLVFTKCKYYNNFGQYYITDGYNYNPTFLLSKGQVNDTTLNIYDAKFGGESRLWLRVLPKLLPDNYVEDDWNIYSTFISSRHGKTSFKYDRISIIDHKNIAFTRNGDIYKYNIGLNQKTDSIINKSARYGFLNTTPAGTYLYAIDENNNTGSPVYFWSTKNLSRKPDHTFEIQYTIPPVSDNLIAIKSLPSNISPSQFAIYSIVDNNIIYSTDYDETSSRPKISSNGAYFFISDVKLKLCSYKNGAFNLIWEENDWSKDYKFYDFSPLNNDICYVWDYSQKFSIRSTHDFSEISSFTVDLEELINIDYYNNRIMGYVSDKIRVYNLEDGTLEEEIHANLSELFLTHNNTILLGNTIYSNHGIKYTLE